MASCIYCFSDNTKRDGKREDGKQRWKCNQCGRRWTERKGNISEKEREDVLKELESAIPFQRVGVLDIETTGLWSDFGYILVAVFKDITAGIMSGKYEIFRLDETKVMKDEKALKDPETWKRIDRELLEKIMENVKKYDVIVHFNGRNFDIKFLNTRLIKNNLSLLPAVKQVDIYQIAKHRMRLRSKALEALREFLEVDMEAAEHKWEYWQMAAARVKEGFDYVVQHCCRDVDRLAEVAVRMKQFIQYIK